MGKKQEDNKKVNIEEFEKLQQELDAVKELSIQLDNQLKRAVADYQNLEKRVAEGRSELTRWGTGELLGKILPVLDHLDQALSGVKESSESESQSGWIRGVELAVKEFKNVLQSEGLEEIPAEGEFNPALQEAVDTTVGEDNKILKIVRKGYSLNGKVLRPAAVVVGRKEVPSMDETKNIPGGETQSDVYSPVEEKGEDK